MYLSKTDSSFTAGDCIPIRATWKCYVRDLRPRHMDKAPTLCTADSKNHHKAKASPGQQHSNVLITLGSKGHFSAYGILPTQWTPVYTHTKTKRRDTVPHQNTEEFTISKVKYIVILNLIKVTTTPGGQTGAL